MYTENVRERKKKSEQITHIDHTAYKRGGWEGWGAGLQVYVLYV